MHVISSGSFGGGRDGPRRCSFCGRREDTVEKLVRARGAYICDRCVEQAQTAISSAQPGEKLLRIRPPRARLADRDTAEEAVELAFETVSTTDAPIIERCAAIERGANLVPVMEDLRASDAEPQNLDVSVESIRFLSDDEAEVHFVLLSTRFGSAGLAQAGHAVRVDGEWKVARDTWCRLVAMVGVQCPPPEE